MKTPEDIAQGRETFISVCRTAGHRLFFLVSDAPGNEYPPHAHDASSFRTEEGSALVLTDDRWVLNAPGHETHVADGQRHAALVGEDGWKYVFACSFGEAMNQNLFNAAGVVFLNPQFKI